ncbi:MAG TPA: M14 family metallopeptidase [Herpetosiphonaceae bacterium]|nr:M14 family metallopeptidase [Herpetosiphonaceae bacterium]
MHPAVSRGAQPAPPIVELTFGTSAEGRPITGTRIGDGPRKLFIVANTHGGPEANTYQLALALQQYFREHPGEVPAAVSLYIIPTVNPDGLSINTRFNSRSVDLNRNMDTNFDACPENDWNQTVEGAYGYVSDTGGAFVESEVESQLVRDLVLDAAGVVWLHSSGGDVFPAFCEHAPSIALAQAYAAASGYRYDRYWGQYNITGGMHDWAGALGIASITPELATGTEPEVEANLAAVQAILADHKRLLPLQPSTVEGNTGVQMPTLLWRYWRAHGGPEWYGPPISPVVNIDGRETVYFETQHLILTPEGADALQPVRTGEGGRALWNEYLLDSRLASYQLR